MVAKVTPSNSIKMFRYRVHFLAKELWQEKDPICRMNLALQLADAATSLARLEVGEVQNLQQQIATEQISNSTES